MTKSNTAIGQTIQTHSNVNVYPLMRRMADGMQSDGLVLRRLSAKKVRVDTYRSFVSVDNLFINENCANTPFIAIISIVSTF